MGLSLECAYSYRQGVSDQNHQSQKTITFRDRYRVGICLDISVLEVGGECIGNLMRMIKPPAIDFGDEKAVRLACIFVVCCSIVGVDHPLSHPFDIERAMIGVVNTHYYISVAKATCTYHTTLHLLPPNDTVSCLHCSHISLHDNNHVLENPKENLPVHYIHFRYHRRDICFQVFYDSPRRKP